MAMLPSLATSLSGMKTAQSQLEIISRNVANVDTVGYTRKTAQQNNVVLAGYPYGVSLGNITREVNEGLLKSFLSSNSTTQNLSAKSEYLSKTDILLGTPAGNNSISANVATLQSSFEVFAADVSSAASRYTLLTNASTLTSRLNYLTTEIQTLRGDADVAVSGAVTQANQYLDEIKALNDSIVKYTVLGYDGVPDLEDKRDTALRNLSGLIDISYFTRENGEIVIQTKEGVQLLDRDPHYLSHSAMAQASATTSYQNGGINGIYVDGVDITKQIRDGEIKGLIDVRDKILVDLQSQLDELARVMKDSINAIHNQGTAFPQTPSSLTGLRTFIDSSVQQIRIENGDVRFTIFDTDGREVVTTTLGGGLGFTGGTIDDMASAIDAWLTSPTGANLPQAKAEVDSNGNFVINTGDSYYTVSIMDEKSSTPGSGQQDVTIKFDDNGDGNYDRTFQGFSNFFKMNDFFTGSATEAIYDSKVLDRSVNLGLTNTIRLSFSSSSSGLNYANIEVNPNDSLQTIVDKINNNQTLSRDITASLVPNGNGVVLRIMSSAGEQVEIAEDTSFAPYSGVLERLGLDVSDVGLSGVINIRNELKVSPGMIAAGSPEFNFNSGEYELNVSINNIANAMAKVFSDAQSFNQTGSLAPTKTTLSNYASTFVGIIASTTSSAVADLAYQSELTNSIATKEAEISGVDMDEELAQLILFQQSYAACAQSFTVAKEMIDVLLGIV